MATGAGLTGQADSRNPTTNSRMWRRRLHSRRSRFWTVAVNHMTSSTRSVDEPILATRCLEGSASNKRTVTLVRALRGQVQDTVQTCCSSETHKSEFTSTCGIPRPPRRTTRRNALAPSRRVRGQSVGAMESCPVGGRNPSHVAPHLLGHNWRCRWRRGADVVDSLATD